MSLRPDSNSPTFATSLPRRKFMQGAAGTLLAAGIGAAAQQPASKPNADNYVQLSQIHAPTDAADKAPGPEEPTDKRIGFAIVGLGRLTINQILPAFGKSKYCKPVAFVSGHDGNLDKAHKLAAQYGIKPSSIYSYADYDKLAHNPDVQVIYVVLPNSLHAEYVTRGAKLGKHILCEKPMATTVADCERMITACRAANVKLMLAYRQQYEPNNLALLKMIREGKLGKLRSFIATNTQNQGDPSQWRLKRDLAGGGCLPDVGIYCLNAARFLSGEEPNEVSATLFQPKDDPRFTEVEATCSFTLRFPSGLIATCNTGYGGHHSQFLRMEGTDAWAELSPAFGYTGNKLRFSHLVDGQELTAEPTIEAKDQFAEEMDHMAQCVMQNTRPHTGGEEGLQDQRITDALYKSAHTGQVESVPAPSLSTRTTEMP